MNSCPRYRLTTGLKHPLAGSRQRDQGRVTIRTCCRRGAVRTSDTWTRYRLTTCFTLLHIVAGDSRHRYQGHVRIILCCHLERDTRTLDCLTARLPLRANYDLAVYSLEGSRSRGCGPSRSKINTDCRHGATPTIATHAIHLLSDHSILS